MISLFKVIVSLFFLFLLCGVPGAQAGDWKTCTYRDPKLAAECRNDPSFKDYLRYNGEMDHIEEWEDLPPAVRGWAPGEEGRIIDAIRAAPAPPVTPQPSLPPRFLLDADKKALLADLRATLDVLADGPVLLSSASVVIRGENNMTACGHAIYPGNIIGNFILDTRLGGVRTLQADRALFARLCSTPGATLF